MLRIGAPAPLSGPHAERREERFSARGGDTDRARYAAVDDPSGVARACGERARRAPAEVRPAFGDVETRAHERASVRKSVERDAGCGEAATARAGERVMAVVAERDPRAGDERVVDRDPQDAGDVTVADARGARCCASRLPCESERTRGASESAASVSIACATSSRAIR
ncbi:hypothetical protein WPS_02510 [Vulcanimicrobium alpinum]|uniref:Uncharacterized protein n=1 Tax=Vulcanimicrobium alpinum TaxID=3016050 RepID=A0AAN1XTK7_UNVUL|nr:hypothetical protein WPS_02510 [Vulcanimicrobium alpinum]